MTQFFVDLNFLKMLLQPFSFVLLSFQSYSFEGILIFSLFNQEYGSKSPLANTFNECVASKRIDFLLAGIIFCLFNFLVLIEDGHNLVPVKRVVDCGQLLVLAQRLHEVADVDERAQQVWRENRLEDPSVLLY